MQSQHLCCSVRGGRRRLQQGCLQRGPAHTPQVSIQQQLFAWPKSRALTMIQHAVTGLLPSSCRRMTKASRLLVTMAQMLQQQRHLQYFLQRRLDKGAGRHLIQVKRTFLLAQREHLY